MNKTLRYFFTLMMVLLGAQAYAQVRVEQSVDSVGILIGQQCRLNLAVTMPKDAHVTWPALKPNHYVVPGVEVLHVNDGPTETLDNGEVKVERSYTITSFDEKLYAIPALPVKVNGKTYSGGTSALKVITVDVDTLHPNQFFPAKDVQDNPFLWSEWSPLFWISIVLLLLGLFGFYIFSRLRQNKPIITRIRVIKHVPAHQRALKEIDRIKADGMQSSEDQKTYYTHLTDTLRDYIEERFGFNAKEMTSAEIIESLESCDDNEMLRELTDLFNTADLVKFAKYSTLLNENDMNLVHAINFIDKTKLEDKTTIEKIVSDLSEDDKRAKQSRITLKVTLWCIALAMVGVACFMAIHLYQLMG